MASDATQSVRYPLSAYRCPTWRLHFPTHAPTKSRPRPPCFGANSTRNSCDRWRR